MARNTKSYEVQMRRGVVELCILALLSKKACYANDIVQAMQQARMIVVEGTIYPMLSRLKNAGYLVYRWEESKQGPPRKYYVLSAHGVEYLKELLACWQETEQVVNAILQGVADNLSEEPIPRASASAGKKDE